VNRRHIKITYLLTAPEPARGKTVIVIDFYTLRGSYVSAAAFDISKAFDN